MNKKEFETSVVRRQKTINNNYYSSDDNQNNDEKTPNRKRDNLKFKKRDIVTRRQSNVT